MCISARDGQGPIGGVKRSSVASLFPALTNVMDAVSEDSAQPIEWNGTGMVRSTSYDAFSSGATDYASAAQDHSTNNARKFVLGGMGGSFKTPYEMRGVNFVGARRWYPFSSGDGVSGQNTPIPHSYDHSFEQAPNRKPSSSRSFANKEPEAYKQIEDHLKPQLSAGENAVHLVKAMMEVSSMGCCCRRCYFSARRHKPFPIQAKVLTRASFPEGGASNVTFQPSRLQVCYQLPQGTNQTPSHRVFSVHNVGAPAWEQVLNVVSNVLALQCIPGITLRVHDYRLPPGGRAPSA